MTSKLEQLRQMKHRGGRQRRHRGGAAVQAGRLHHQSPRSSSPALGTPAFADVVTKGLDDGRPRRPRHQSRIAGDLTVAVGAELARIVPAGVSTEVDSPAVVRRRRLDPPGARHRRDLRSRLGVGRERILIKLASTWEGARARRRRCRRRGSTST